MRIGGISAMGGKGGCKGGWREDGKVDAREVSEPIYGACEGRDARVVPGIFF
jgi:hypothetical protein